MRFSQFVVLAAVAFVLCCSTDVAADNTAQNPNLATNVSPSGAHRYLKGSKTTTDLDAVDEERVGATTPKFKQLFGSISFPKISNLPGLKQIKAALIKRDTKRIESAAPIVNQNSSREKVVLLSGPAKCELATSTSSASVPFEDKSQHGPVLSPGDVVGDTGKIL
ncbi:hypothetical protein C6341_g16606 [Phytophthora cactorum]|nr:hypothetical protein C6341_g16606 [Phytophthora cactorum]